MCSQITLPYWEAVPLPTRKYNQQPETPHGMVYNSWSFYSCGFVYCITHMSLFFMPCILQRSLKQLSNSSCNLSLGLFNGLKCFQSVAGLPGLGCWARLSTASQSSPPLSLETVKRHLGTGLGNWIWVALLRAARLVRMASRDLSRLSIAYFSHACNVPIGKVWQLPVRAQGVCKAGGGKYEGNGMRGAPNVFFS